VDDLKDIETAIFISDVHAGCRVGLCPPEGVKLDDGGTYMPSDFQLKVWTWWREFWDEWVPKVTRGARYCVILNGDSTDGRHHGSTTQISQNLADQENIAYQILAPVVDKCKGVYYHVRGTEAHVGVSGENEERLAGRLGAIKNAEGQSARNELWKYLGGDHTLMHILHHIGTTGASAYESTAPHKELVEAFVEAGRWNDRPPDVIVRSHRHRYFKTEIASHNDRAMSVVTPGWQGKTPFVYKIAGGRQSQPQFGGIMIRVSEEGELYERHYVKRLERPLPE